MLAAVAAAQIFAAENQKAIESVAALQAAISALHGTDVHIGVDAAAATAAAAATRDLAAASGEAAAAETAESGALASMAVALDVVKRDMADASADLMMQTALLREMRDAWLTAGVAAVASSDAIAASTRSAGDAAGRASGTFTTWLGVLNRMAAAAVPLFGGAGFFGIMKTVTGIHLLADATAELAAVLIPASVALAAFGVAAVPTLQDIYRQMSNVYTVSQATGQAIYPLSGSFASIAQAVQPEVYTLFGEALKVINSRMGTFATLATQAGQVLDQLGARAGAALLSSGMSQFFHNAAADLQGLGTVIGNVFGTLGNLLRTLPGYAQILLQALVGVTHALEAVTGSGVVQGIIGIGLAFHGAILWAGLLFTAVMKLGPALWAWIGPAIARLVALGVAFSAVAAEEGVFAATTAALSAVNPLVWVVAAVAALGALVYALATAKTSTQQWAGSLEQAVGKAPAVSGLITLLGAQAQVSARLAFATHQYGITASRAASATAVLGGGFQAAGRAAQLGIPEFQALSAIQRQLSDQSNLYRYRVGVLAHALGSTSAAMGMLAVSGVTMNQMLAYGKDNLAKLEAQVLGTAAAYRAMGQTGGMLGADMNVMNVLASDQYNAVSKLNQAWQAWMQTVTGGMSSLSQFETALSNMKADAAATSAGLSGSISSIKSGVGGMTYTLKGFGPAAQQSWQQFTSAVNQGNAVIAQMRTYMALGAVSNQAYTSTIKALVGQMIPFTQGNKAALTMLENLAVQAGGPATNSLKALQQWAGVSGKAARDQLAKGLEAATIAGGQLSQVAQHLSSVLGSQLSAMVSQAAIKASGLRSAVNNLTTAMQYGGSMSNMFHGNLVPVIGDLLKLHQDVPTITAYLQGLGIHISAAGVAAIIASAHLGSLGNSAQSAGGKMSAAAAQAHNLGSAISSLHSKTITVTTVFSYTGHLPGGGTIAYPVKAAAEGTAAAAAGAYLVGERGPELVMMRGGEQVMPAGVTAALMAAMRPSPSPAALRTGGLPLRGGGAGAIVIENHLHLDGKEIFNSVKQASYRYQTANAGQRTGLLIPGTRPQV